MKKFVRRPWVQSTLAWLVSTYLGFTMATIRWRYEDWDKVASLVREPVGVIGCFWHGRIALAVACRPKIRGKPRRVLNLRGGRRRVAEPAATTLGGRARGSQRPGTC